MLAELVAFAFAESVVVTAARLPQSPEELVRPVTVITAEDIARAGQQSLVDLLQALGGVEVSRNGGYGQFSSVFIRGANFNHTLVLVDGIRVSSATSGATAFENIPLNAIERIEIVPGPASGLYGSDAIGGVVQIFTKAGGVPGASVAFGGGTDDTRSFRASAAGGSRDTSFSLNAGYFSTRGFSATKPSIAFGQFNPDDDGYRNANVSAKVVHRYGGGDHEIGAALMHSRGRTWFDSGEGFDDLTDETLAAYSIHSRDRFAPWWESLVRAGEGRDEATTRGSFPSVFNTRQPQATWQNTFAAPFGNVIAGYEFVRQRIETDSGFAVNSRDIESWFGGYSGHWQAHAWQVNGRHDDNDQFGAHWTGNAGYAYQLTAQLRLRAGAGSAFKAPTFNDLYFPGFGNAGLRPERSRSAEAGFDWRAGSHAITATVFDNRIEDLIVFDFTTSRPENVERARARGTELGYRFESGALGASLKATVQGDPLPRRARRFGSANARYSRSGWTLQGEVVAATQRLDAGEVMHGYAVFNVAVERNLGRGFTARLRWNNVADARYELVRHYNAPGSNLFLEVSFAAGGMRGP